ncbi:hypothetical protein HZS_3578 [Henneguya salminicola]|nr:hypothetical protein HZS_3578 [Henneguya salminicola]
MHPSLFRTLQHTSSSVSNTKYLLKKKIYLIRKRIKNELFSPPLLVKNLFLVCAENFTLIQPVSPVRKFLPLQCNELLN